jgi:hypothetical protein
MQETAQYNIELKFMSKYRLLDIHIRDKIKDLIISIKEDLYECNGLTVFYGDAEIFKIIYPLLQILCKNIQTLSIGGNSTIHPISWTPGYFIIPNDILFE